MQPETIQINLIEPANNPLRSLSASRHVSFGKADSYHRQLLEKALSRAEVGLCDYSAVISVDPQLKTDFLVGSAGEIVLNEQIFSCPPVLRLHLRHAIELTLWFKLCPRMTGASSLAVTLLAAMATTRFYLQMLTAERQQISFEIPGWLKHCATIAEVSSEEQLLRELASQLGALRQLQGGEPVQQMLIEEAIQVALPYTAIAKPTEVILTQQGDERLLVDAATGLNKYGCSPRPRPEAITFSSCTASSVSEYAYREAESLRHRLMKTFANGSLAAEYETEIETIRSGLKQVLDLEAINTEVILSSSGTDAELYPLTLFCSPSEKLVNIVVAPDEVGGGTVQAAGGRHFSAKTPLGAKFQQGSAIEGLDTESIQVVGIPVRDENGFNLTPKELKQRVADAVTQASRDADKIILHIVDNTKTGIIAPDTDFVLALQETFRSQLLIVVDACQFRLEKANVHQYLAHGFCVLVTGSKFFTGPPFGGALLIPPHFKISSDGLPLPRGFGDYFTNSEVPPVLKSRAQHLSTDLNFGLLFRWVGALKEMTAFYCVPSEQRTTILQTFRRELIESIRSNSDLHLVECPMPHRWQNGDEMLWDAQPTIFSFGVRDPRATGSDKWLPIRDLKKIYYLLNRNCAEDLPTNASAADLKLAKQKCHIGQPVTTWRCAENGETGALRIACGARLVYGITYDGTLGSSPAERFHREITDARTVLAKVSLILKHWKFLCEEAGS
jgi:hypothetical protein